MTEEEKKIVTITKLHFVNVDRIEPDFHPDVKEYKVYPSIGAKNIHFSVETDMPSAPAADKKDFYYEPYADFKLYYYTTTMSYGWSKVIPSENDPQEHKFYIETSPQYAKDVHLFCEAKTRGLPSKEYVLNVQPYPLAPGECGHFNTYKQDGDVFGGASGSCSIETLIICKDCGATVGKEWEYCN